MSQPALAATSGFPSVGFITTATVTFCLSATSEVYITGDSTATGPLSVDDMLVYQLDSNAVVGIGFFPTTCSVSGFLSISAANVQVTGFDGNGPAFSLGTLTAGSHTLKIGTYNCEGIGYNGVINVAGCSMISCSAPVTTTTTSGGGSSTSSPAAQTVWSGSYTVNPQCSTTQCCCISGSFTLTQVGTLVTGTVPLSGVCGGATSAPVSVTLSSATATSASISLGGQTIDLVKNGATVTATNVASPACSGSFTCTSGDCLPAASVTCFHESTRIQYKGKDHTLASLQQGDGTTTSGDCHVPHIVYSNGVSIEIACPQAQSVLSKVLLRLTADHLVFTGSGLKSAGSLAAGDVVFSDMQQTQECHVVQVQEEKNQRYFGLNCADESVVLANGIKTSTFGHYHWIPSIWMKYCSHMIGVKAASSIGDSIVNLLHRVGFFSS